MRFLTFALAILLAASFSHSRSLVSIRRDALTVGVSKSDSASEYNFISEMNRKMKFPRFRIVVFDNANVGQKLLLDGKIDVIISKVNHSPGLESRFLLSSPYDKTDIAVATLANSSILTLSNLDGKSLAFVSKEVSSDQILGIWKGSKPNAVQSLDDAVDFLQRGESVAIIACRQSLESRKDNLLRVFPNKLFESNIVALFAPGSRDLHAEFNKALAIAPPPSVPSQGAKSSQKPSDRERVAKILQQVDELKKELELLLRELK
jgi:ABC-type amino acid transport substrate-binding protein